MRWLLTIPLLCFALLVKANDPEAMFNEANLYYEQESYDTCLTLFLELATDYESAELYYNIGNTYYRLDSMGKAILYFERAQRLSPGNEDIAFNLRLANQKILDEIPAGEASRIGAWWQRFIANPHWPSMSLWFQLIGFGLLAGYLLVKTRIQKQLLFYSGAIVIVLGLTAMACSGFYSSRLGNDNEAIVMVSEVHVLSAPTSTSEVNFVLHEGTKLEITDTDGDWVEIKIANGTVGWLSLSSIEIV